MWCCRLRSRPVDLGPEDLRAALGLEPHPTCGFVAETFRSTARVDVGGVPGGFEGTRPLGSALYFLVTPEANIKLHRIRNDQLYHHYLGAPLEVLLLLPDGTTATRVVGSDIAAGMRPQLLIPGGTFHTSRLPDGGWALLASTEWPGVEPADVEQGDPEQLAASHPDAADRLRSSGHSAGAAPFPR
jgi:predicted cupin superfamily sugar epimerase